MCVRRAEQREQGVADELVDETAELLHRSGQFFEQLVLKRLHDLGVELFGKSGETAEVREQDRDGAPVCLARKGRYDGQWGNRNGPERRRRSERRRRLRSWWRLDRVGRCTLFLPTFWAKREIGRAGIAAAGAAGGLARAAFRAKRKLCLNDETATDAVHRKTDRLPRLDSLRDWDKVKSAVRLRPRGPHLGRGGVSAPRPGALFLPAAFSNGIQIQPRHLNQASGKIALSAIIANP